MTAPQIILAGENLGVLASLSVDDLVAHHFRVSQELLAARRIAAGWDPEVVLTSQVIPFPDADPKDIAHLLVQVRILDVLVSQRTGVRTRTLIGKVG